MNSDPISEGSPPKRRRLDHDSSGPHPGMWHSDNDDGDDLFDNIDHATMPTQPLSQYKRNINPHMSTPRPAAPTQSQSAMPRPSGTFSSFMAKMGQGTQPTQPLDKPIRFDRSSPDVEVLASSPMQSSPASGGPIRARPAGGSSMAPPGTAFRRPGTVATQPRTQVAPTMRPSQDSIDPSNFVDPPRVAADDSEDDELNTKPTAIKPTNFTRGTRNFGSDFISSAPDFSRFSYNPVDDLASAYGAARRSKPPARQLAPSRAQPAIEMTVDDIINPDIRSKVERMQDVVPNYSVPKLFAALTKHKGHFDDACNALFEESDEPEKKPIDLTSSDNERDRKVQKPITSRQDIHATKKIKDKYNAQINRKLKTVAPAPRPIQTAPDVVSPPPKPLRRLRQGPRKTYNEDDEEEEPEPEAEDEPEEEETEESSESETQEPAKTSGGRLLDFLNKCDAPALADLANERTEMAQLIVSHRPFGSLEDVRAVTDPTVKTTGKRSARKTVGERILDVCEQMWDGYEAVDQLVAECKALGQPVLDAMKQWTHGQVRDGELNVTRLESPHDSGIGTPSSAVDDDVPVKKTTGLLKQPAIMSKDLVMKDYQITGLNWLNLLWSKRLSCILADDMGLGKTCQVISFFAHLKETGVTGTHLVVVPGSTIENWAREFQRFCPDINIAAYYGSMADRLEFQDEYAEADIDVIVTTYDIAAKKDDNKFLRRTVRPRVCVFDEGHVLKNASSQRHHELNKIRAEFRVLLTGTPLQNNLQELISLLGFIMPQVFAERSDELQSIFKYKATTKDASNAALLSTDRIQRARAMLTPFILRRKKAQVLSALPAKTRRVQYCDMVPEQQKLWRSLVSKARRAKVAQEEARGTRKGQAVTAGSQAGAHMTSLRFAALHPLLLRRIYTDAKLRKLQKLLVDHPYSEFRGNPKELVWKYLTQDLKGGDYALHKFCLEHEDFVPKEFQLRKEEWMTLSGKMPVLREMLEKWIAAGSRALIFSQFTTMLDILEAFLSTLDIKCVRLDGSTKMDDRQTLIDAFSNDDSYKVFMLSTKAGGAGINLAAADKVVILEGGFNPQDEVQAENRAHRVGQERDVEVVRLVTRGTVEEIILRVGEVKLRLDEKVHEGDKGEGGGNEADVVVADDEEGRKKVEEIFFGSLDEGAAGADDAEEMEVAGEDEEEAEEEEEEEHPKGVTDEKMAGKLQGEEASSPPRTRAGRRTRAATAKEKNKKSLAESDTDEGMLLSSSDNDDQPPPPPGGKRKRTKVAAAATAAEAETLAAKRKRLSRHKTGRREGDIGDMFKKGLRERGLRVED